MATATTPAVSTSTAKPVRIVAWLLVAAGVLMIVAGLATWLTVRGQLVAENITIPDDAMAFQGKTVDGPLDAFVQADIINEHALEGSDGKTYAELDREDPARASVMNASFLRTSLFSSVIAFGVAAFAGGMGIVQILTGWALLKLTPVTAKAPATA